MRAVKGSLGHSLYEKFGEVEGPRSTRAIETTPRPCWRVMSWEKI